MSIRDAIHQVDESFILREVKTFLNRYNWARKTLENDNSMLKNTNHTLFVYEKFHKSIFIIMDFLVPCSLAFCVSPDTIM